MKTYTKIVNDSTVVIGGIDKMGVRGDLLEITEECVSSQPHYRVYFLAESCYGEPIKTFLIKDEAITKCRNEIRSIKMLMGSLKMRELRFDYL